MCMKIFFRKTRDQGDSYISEVFSFLVCHFDLRNHFPNDKRGQKDQPSGEKAFQFLHLSCSYYIIEKYYLCGPVFQLRYFGGLYVFRRQSLSFQSRFYPRFRLRLKQQPWQKTKESRGLLLKPRPGHVFEMDSKPLRLRRRRQKRPHRFLLKTKENHIVHAINCIFYFATKAIKRIYRATSKPSYTLLLYKFSLRVQWVAVAPMPSEDLYRLCTQCSFHGSKKSVVCNLARAKVF